MAKICFFSREILETTLVPCIDSPERDSSKMYQLRYTIGDFWVLINLLIFNEPYEMFIWQSFLYLFKGAKRMDFVLSSPKCPKWPKELREKNFHANSGIKILPNIIINCWLLKLFSLGWCLLTYWKIHYSHLPLQKIFPTLTSKQKH